MRHVNVQMKNGQNVRCGGAELYPVYTAKDPTCTHRMVFSTHAARMAHITSTVAPGTPRARNFTNYGRHPDTMHWIAAYETALKKFDEGAVVDWMTNPPNNTKPIPLTVSLQYKWDRTGA